MNAPPPLLAGRRGLVLGLSGPNSLGYACLQDLRRLGADLAVTYRPGREQTCVPLAEQAGCRHHFAVDAADEESIAAAGAGLAGRWDSLDFVVHTWVTSSPGLLTQPLLTVSAKDFHHVLEVGARSLLGAVRSTLPMLTRSDAPRVVALTSTAYEQTMPNYHVLGITKAALVAAVRYLALDLGPQGVLCNAVSFSLLPTAGARRALGDDTAERTHAYLAKRSPTRQPLRTRDVTNAIGFLASPLCANLTGEVLTVDGGFAGSYFS